MLLKHQVDLIGYDVWEEARLAFKNEGGIVATSAAKCTEGAQVMVLMVVNATQAEKVLFSPDVLAGEGHVTKRSSRAYVRLASQCPQSTHEYGASHASRGFIGSVA